MIGEQHKLKAAQRPSNSGTPEVCGSEDARRPPVSAERRPSTVISINVTMPHMGHISRANEAESSPSPRGPNSSKSVKPFNERNQKELAYTKLTDPRENRDAQRKKSLGSLVNRPQARKNLKAENGKGPNIQTATTLTGYLGRLLREESHRTVPNTLRKTKTDGRRGQGRETDSRRSEG